MYIYIYDISGVQVVESRNAGKQISLGWRIVMFQNEYTPMTADIHYNMMIINCIYFFLICISFKFNGLSSIVFFFGKSCSSSCWWKGWIRCPNPFSFCQQRSYRWRAYRRSSLRTRMGGDFFGGFVFFFGSVIEMCKSGWNSQKLVEHLPALAYLQYVHLVDLFTCGKYM